MAVVCSHLVIGAGAIGAAIAYRLAQAGAERVIVLEQFELGHALGSSGDHSRLIRASYHRPEYGALAPEMFRSWREIEARTGLPLYHRIGGLDLAQASDPHALGQLRAYRAAVDVAGLEAEDLDAAGIRARFPQWRIDDDVEGFAQPDAGFVDIRRSVSAHVSLALAAGVEFRPRTRATGIELREGRVVVRADGETFEAGSLAIAAASWAQPLYEELGLRIPLALSEEQVSYYTSTRLADFAPERFPVWVWHGRETYYGFPVHGEAGVKLGQDLGGRLISSEERTHLGDDATAAPLRRFLDERLPAVDGPALRHLRCVYDMAPDREFILDAVPGHPNVAIANGAGHAGKFAPLLGEIVAELLLEGASSRDLAPFRLDRPAIVDPRFEPTLHLGVRGEGAAEDAPAP